MTSLPTHPIRLTDQKSRGTIPFDLVPNKVQSEAIAADLGILGLAKVVLRGTLVPEGRRDWRLDAQLGARVTQACGVTLAPVMTRIDEAVTRRFAAEVDAVGPGEVEMPADVDTDPLPDVLDLYAVLTEALALALPAFPRAPGVAFDGIAVTAKGATPLTPGNRPFADLGALRDKLATDTGEDPET